MNKLPNLNSNVSLINLLFTEIRSRYLTYLSLNFKLAFASLLFLQKRELIRLLIGTCLNLAEESEVDPVDMLSDELAKEVKITKQVTSHRDPFGIPEVCMVLCL